VNSSFLDHFTVNGVEVDLSPGINAIIGENGAGKSSLLEMMMTGGKQSQSHVKKLQQDNRIDMPKTLSGGDNVLYVRQNDLERRYWNKGGMFEESQYPQVDNSAFERKMRAWSASVKGAVKRHIQSKTLADRLATTSYVIKPQLEAGTYYPHIAKSEGFERVENPHKARLENINNALDILNSEMGSGYYKDDSQEKADLQTAISALCRISEVISSRSQRATKISEARNAVSLAISKYNSSIQPLQTAKDREKTDYQRKKSAVLDAVVEEARNACKPPVNIVPISLPAGAGTSENPSRGFKFVSTAAYSDNSEIAETFLAENMNVRFQTLEDVLKIQSTQEIEAAIPRRRQGDWEARWDSMVENFISDEEKMSRFIKGNSDRRVGNTLGEQSLTYYEYCSYQGSGIDVFVIDQPEDHISNARISKRLIGFFNRMRRAKQVILVTHSPLLVVNQDVDNVVCLKTEAGKMSVKSGCLEYGDILQEISQQMDGGTEAIKRRLRVYGEAV
jgi:predicted ATPase